MRHVLILALMILSLMSTQDAIADNIKIFFVEPPVAYGSKMAASQSSTSRQ